MKAVGTPPRRRLRGWAPNRLQLFVSVLLFTEAAYYAVVAPLLPHFRDLGASTSDFGLLVGGYPAGLVAGGLLAVWLMGRIGVRRSIALGLATLAAASAPFGLVDDVTALQALRLMQGIGGAWAWAGALAWLVGASPAEGRGRTIGTAFGWSIAGGAAGPMVGAIALEVGLGASFVALGVLEAGLAAVAIALRSVPSPGPEPHPPPRAAFVARPLLGIIVVLGLAAMWFGAYEVFIPLRLVEAGGGAAAVAVVFTIAAGAEAVISPITGWLADRIGPGILIRAGLLSTPLVVLAVAAAEGVVAVGAVAVLAWLTVALALVPTVSHLSNVSERIGIGQAVTWSLANVVLATGAAIGSAGGAALGDRTSNAVPFVVLATACIVAALVTRIQAPRA